MRHPSRRSLQTAKLSVAFIFYLSCALSLSGQEQEEVWIVRDWSAEIDDWRVVRWRGKPVVEANGESLLLTSNRSSFGLRKDVGVSLERTPILTWSWRVFVLPEGAMFRSKSTDDQAAQLYVIFRSRLFQKSHVIGYIWDTETEVGTTGPSAQKPQVMYVVLRNKENSLATWFTERRDVFEDYRTLFGADPPRVTDVSVYINSQHTKSSAKCEFGSIRFLKRSQQ